MTTPSRPCRAVLNIKGEHFACDGPYPHDIHGSVEAGAIWVSDVEARALPDTRDSGEQS